MSSGRDQQTHHHGFGDPSGVPVVPGDEDLPAGPIVRLLKDRRTAFLVVGGVNTVVGLGAFVVFHRLYSGSDLGKTAVSMLTLISSHIVSVVVAFVLYRYLVFRVRGNLVRDAVRFETVYLSGLLVNAVLLWLGSTVLDLPTVPVQVVIVVLTAVWSWVGHGRFSFRRT
ncbi:GtrA family protein [Flexivirga sp. ID2601S]|uniref:GtrA family protein n=1 Tax=Flexivirga aerilata TaxID=1656889 RepID=A0A849AGH3_9MICO|nr:GtrA family protein [Flexivirga aerilata]NNG38993.1 GtrA family protein [Flexivirga aerilata]